MIGCSHLNYSIYLMNTTTTIIFKSRVVRCLLEGSYYLSTALILLGRVEEMFYLDSVVRGHHI